VSWTPTRLRYVADLNPPIRSDLIQDPTREVSFLPMEAVGEDGGLNLERTRTVADVRNGYSYFEDGDVAIAKVTPCFENGKGALMRGLAGGAGFGTTELTVLRPRPGVDARFLRYFLASAQFMAEATGAMTGAGGLKRVPDWFVRDYPARWPEHGVQERIANFVDDKTARIDALIAEKATLADTLAEFRSSKTRELVLRGLDGESTRKTHIRWIEEVPLGWQVPRIKHVATLESGHTPDKKVPAYWENCAIPWVSLNDTNQLLTTDYIEETAFQVNDLGIKNSSARLLPQGTVFFSRDATIGRCGIAAKPMACSQHFIGWVCGPKLLPEYLLHVLRSMGDELERLTMGATLKTIGMDDVKTLSMPLPPLGEQKRIVRVVRELRSKTSDVETQTLAFVERLREYRSSLISAAVTGQLDLSTSEATTPVKMLEAA
jgi:type I restriction enzyme, S subunit